jgi:hypothetical protein
MRSTPIIFEPRGGRMLACEKTATIIESQPAHAEAVDTTFCDCGGTADVPALIPLLPQPETIATHSPTQGEPLRFIIRLRFSTPLSRWRLCLPAPCLGFTESETSRQPVAQSLQRDNVESLPETANSQHKRPIRRSSMPRANPRSCPRLAGD